MAHTLYKIYYNTPDGCVLVYLGRTNQPLGDRIRAHVLKKPMCRAIDIHSIGKIEYTELPTESDMNLYEIYYILKYKPRLNVDDKAKDKLNVTLPELEWKEWSTDLWDKWEKNVDTQDQENAQRASRINVIIPQELAVLRDQYKEGKISQEEFSEKHRELIHELQSIRKNTKCK